MNKVSMSVHEAQKQNERAEYHKYYCQIDDCPLLKIGKCIHMKLFGGCVYGECSAGRTVTKRARGYYTELKKLELEKESFPKTRAFYDDIMCEIGEYYYLPYAHMTMCENIPFVSHSNLLMSGIPFIKVENFTPEVIVALVKFIPCALFGGEITKYQKEVVPAFLLHLSLKFNDLFTAACELDQSIKNRVPDFSKISELEASLADVPYNETRFKVRMGSNRYFDVLSYDEEHLAITGPYSYLLLIIGPRSKDLCTIDIKNPDKYETKILITDKDLIIKAITNNPSLFQKG